MLIRRTDIDKIVCGKCNKDCEVVLREGDIRGSLRIVVYPCKCSEDEPKITPIMFIDDIEKKYIALIGESDTGHKLYTEWKRYE